MGKSIQTSDRGRVILGGILESLALSSLHRRAKIDDSYKNSSLFRVFGMFDIKYSKERFIFLMGEQRLGNIKIFLEIIFCLSRAMFYFYKFNWKTNGKNN